MLKLVRSISLVAVISFAVTPCLLAEQTGTNPHPRANVVALSQWEVFVLGVRAYLGV